MPKRAFIAVLWALAPPLLTASITPVERAEGEGLEDAGPQSPEKNYYLNDDNPFAPASDGDSDLGEQVILRRQPTRAPIYARGDAYLFWSDNLASAADDEESGWYTGGSLTLRWKQHLDNDFFLDVYGYQDAYFYEEDNLDFRSTEFGLGLVKNFSSLGNLSVYGRYEFLYVHAENPIADQPLGGSDTLHSRYHRLRLGAYKALYSRPNHLLSLSANASWDFDSSSSTGRRQQLSARLAYTWNLTAHLRTTVYYRASVRDYLASSREDWNHYAGVELNLTMSEWAELYASLLYGVNESSGGDSDYDYETLQGGLALGLRASF